MCNSVECFTIIIAQALHLLLLFKSFDDLVQLLTFLGKARSQFCVCLPVVLCVWVCFCQLLFCVCVFLPADSCFSLVSMLFQVPHGRGVWCSVPVRGLRESVHDGHGAEETQAVPLSHPPLQVQPVPQDLPHALHGQGP